MGIVKEEFLRLRVVAFGMEAEDLRHVDGQRAIHVDVDGD
jgi:hypothetical protein